RERVRAHSRAHGHVAVIDVTGAERDGVGVAVGAVVPTDVRIAFRKENGDDLIREMVCEILVPECKRDAPAQAAVAIIARDIVISPVTPAEPKLAAAGREGAAHAGAVGAAAAEHAVALRAVNPGSRAQE